MEVGLGQRLVEDLVVSLGHHQMGCLSDEIGCVEVIDEIGLGCGDVIDGYLDGGILVVWISRLVVVWGIL